jgi:hypothetical protein
VFLRASKRPLRVLGVEDRARDHVDRHRDVEQLRVAEGADLGGLGLEAGHPLRAHVDGLEVRLAVVGLLLLGGLLGEGERRNGDECEGDGDSDRLAMHVHGGASHLWFSNGAAAARAYFKRSAMTY